MGIYRSFQAGEFAKTDRFLSEVLGRECEGVEQFLKKEFAIKSEGIKQ